MLLLEDLALLAGLTRLLVLSAHPKTLYKDHAGLGKCTGHFAGLAFFVAGENNYSVAFFNMECVHTGIVIRPQERAK